MEAGENLTASPIELPRDNIDNPERQFDPAVYTAARIFNAVALPDDMPDFLKEAIDAKAEQAKISAQEAGFVAPDTNRLIDGKTIQERERDKDEETQLYVASIIEDERRERERVWDKSNITIGGTVTMSGEEWDDALELLSDPRLRDQLIQNMTHKKGWTQDRAEKAADDALALAQIAQKKKDGTITAEDQTQADDITRRNPDAAVMVKEAARMKNERGFETSLDAGQLEQSALATTNSSPVRKAEIAAAPTDSAFIGAPDLAARFDAARSAPVMKPAPAPEVRVASVNPALDLNATF